ncbi:MAG TPA: PAS domain-containing protein, partial [Janthinobacterium sp.]|nr:PAS domain-containing protein [Janthinobacterium sp.]
MYLADSTPEVQQRIAALEAEIRYLKSVKGGAALDEGGVAAYLPASSGAGAWDWDVRKDMVRADARFAELFGVDAGRAAAGLPIGEFTRAIHAEDRAVTEKAIEEARHSGRKFVAEYRVVHGDGAVRWIVAEGRCDMDADGKPLRFAGV